MSDEDNGNEEESYGQSWLEKTVRRLVEERADDTAGKHWGFTLAISDTLDDKPNILVSFGHTDQGGKQGRGQSWYIDNSAGKHLACLGWGVDSLVVLQEPWKVTLVKPGFFPWPGAVVLFCSRQNFVYSVAISGFDAQVDHDLMAALKHLIITELSKLGDQIIEQVRERGDEGDDRFFIDSDYDPVEQLFFSGS